MAAPLLKTANYLIITVFQGTDVKNRVYYKDLKAKDAPVVKLLDDFDAAYSSSAMKDHGSGFRLTCKRRAASSSRSTRQARRAKLEGRRSRKQRNASRVPSFVNNKFILNYLKDAYTQVRFMTSNGKLVNEVAFPGIGSAGGFGGKATDKETFYSFTGFTTPTTIYRYDMTTGKSTIFRQPKVDFNPAITKPNRSSTRAKTARRCRCSSRIRKA